MFARNNISNTLFWNIVLAGLLMTARTAFAQDIPTYTIAPGKVSPHLQVAPSTSKLGALPNHNGRGQSPKPTIHAQPQGRPIDPGYSRPGTWKPAEKAPPSRGQDRSGRSANPWKGLTLPTPPPVRPQPPKTGGSGASSASPAVPSHRPSFGFPSQPAPPSSTGLRPVPPRTQRSNVPRNDEIGGSRAPLRSPPPRATAQTLPTPVAPSVPRNVRPTAQPPQERSVVVRTVQRPATPPASTIARIPTAPAERAAPQAAKQPSTPPRNANIADEVKTCELALLNEANGVTKEQLEQKLRDLMEIKDRFADDALLAEWLANIPLYAPIDEAAKQQIRRLSILAAEGKIAEIESVLIGYGINPRLPGGPNADFSSMNVYATLWVAGLELKRDMDALEQAYRDGNANQIIAAAEIAQESARRFAEFKLEWLESTMGPEANVTTTAIRDSLQDFNSITNDVRNFARALNDVDGGNNPGGNNPGGNNPGGNNPGGNNPGGNNPGGNNPGGNNPGGNNPGGNNPGGNNPGGNPDGTGDWDDDCDCLWSYEGPGLIYRMPSVPAGEIYRMPHCGCALIYGTGGVGEPEIVEATPAYCGLPIPTQEPLADAGAGSNDMVGKVVVMNPEELGRSVGFVFGDATYDLNFGNTQTFNVTEGIIRFDQGNGRGETAYSLRSGAYKFKLDGKLLTLVRTKFHAKLDNTASRYDFRLLVNGQESLIPAGKLQEIESDYPIVCEFDDGTGQTLSRQLADGQTVTIGINPGSSTWDLFNGDAKASGVGSASDVRSLAANE